MTAMLASCIIVPFRIFPDLWQLWGLRALRSYTQPKLKILQNLERSQFAFWTKYLISMGLPEGCLTFPRIQLFWIKTVKHWGYISHIWLSPLRFKHFNWCLLPQIHLDEFFFRFGPHLNSTTKIIWYKYLKKTTKTSNGYLMQNLMSISSNAKKYLQKWQWWRLWCLMRIILGATAEFWIWIFKH